MGTRITWEWLAGFTDGDGCIWIPRGKKENQPSQIHVTWYQTEANEFVLDEIAQFLESFNVEPKFYLHEGNTNTKSAKPCLHLTVRGCNDTEFVLKSLVPYLVLKYGTAQEAIHKLETLPRGRIYKRRERCVNGHDLTKPENVYERPSGGRSCRVCDKSREKNRVRV